jgi:hypothetical protein
MRHLWSLLLGLVAAPLVWVLVATGQDGSSRTVGNWVKTDTFNWANLIEPAVYLAAAGVLLGLVGMLRISPLGPLVAGLLLVVPYAALFRMPFRVRDAVPDGWRLFGDPLPLDQPLDNGTLFLIGSMLLIATFSAQRWRRWPAAPDAYPQSGDDQPFDWSTPLAQESSPLSLGYPDPPSRTDTLPQAGSGSPWTAPPRSGTGRESGFP